MRETVHEIVAAAHADLAVCPDDTEGRVLFAALVSLASMSEIALDDVWREAAQLHLKRSGRPKGSGCSISDLPDVVQQRCFTMIEFHIKILSTYLASLSVLSGRDITMKLRPHMFTEPLVLPAARASEMLPGTLERAGMRCWRKIVDCGELDALFNFDALNEDSDSEA